MFNIPLPKIQPNRLAVKLKPAAERMVKKKHPWVFEGSITKQNTSAQAGDLAIIYDHKKNKFLACGLFDPHSPIRIKLLQFGKSATINSDWFLQKIQVAYQIRQPLLATNTNSYRLIYGENDGLPGLIADVYDSVLVVKLYSAIWMPYLADILPHLMEVSSSKTLVLRLSRNLQNNSSQTHGLYDGQILVGELPNPTIIFTEHGVRFSANVIAGHKTGYFLDHRHNRRKVGEMAEGKTVLDVFAYTGGFSVHALAGGATAVTSIDISKQALAVAKENAQLNPHKGKHQIMAVDAFEGLLQLQNQNKKFDIVIIDPPSFAKQASEVAKAKHSYQRLAVLGAKLVKKGGLLLLASCSSRITADVFFEIAEQTLATSKQSFTLLAKTFHDIDHPIGFTEGAYLKSGYYCSC